MPLKRVALVSLGGTIASVSAPGLSRGVTPTLDADELLQATPGLQSVAQVESRSLRQMPSVDLTFADLADVAAVIRDAFKHDVDGVVVTQGTDSIEETSFALDLLIDDERPVVVTGAMRNPSVAGADGPANVLAAVTVAAAAGARGLGTLVVMNDEIHAARFVRKTHGSSPSTFLSPQSGPLGIVVEGRVHFFTTVEAISSPPPVRDFAPVALLRCALGDDGRVLATLADLGYRALVVEGMGGGHVPAAMVGRLGELAASMPVVLASRTGAGVVLGSTYGFAGSEIDLLARGLLSAGALDGLKARVALSIALAATRDTAEAVALFRAVVDAVG